MAKAAGHEVVRLPPYHWKLNPIELSWSQVKRHIKENNQLFTLTPVKELTYKGFDQVGPAQWKKLVEHVQRDFEDRYWRDDNLEEEYIDEFVIGPYSYYKKRRDVLHSSISGRKTEGTLNETKVALSKKFEIKDLGELKYFLALKWSNKK